VSDAGVDIESLARFAQELRDAEHAAVPVPPLSERAPGLGIEDAYAIQQGGRELRLARGATLVGHKVGLTSAAMQQQLGVDQPDFGYLTDAMQVPAGGELAVGELIAPRVEAEIAFRLARPLRGDQITREQVLAATEAVAPALEVIDSRVADWRITIVDTIADNASCGRFVVGDFRPLDGLDLAAVEVTMAVGAERVSGRGEAVLGHPAEALVWLTRALAPYGEGLETGEVVLPGAVARALPIAAGDVAEAAFAGLGEIRLHASAGGDR
jgi:2-keto-4-pentenoate hydratase